MKGFTSRAWIETIAAAAFLWFTLFGGLTAVGQTPVAPAPTPPAPQVTTQAVSADAAQGGTIKGTVIAGAVGKPGGVPLPGVAITARNSLTGKQYTTTTDIDGNYAMTIPKNGRYVVRVELTGFAAETHEVILNGGAVATAKDANFGMELASRAAAATQTQASTATTLQRGVQGLNLNADTTNADDATAAGAANANTGAALPSLASLNNSESTDAAADSVAVSGQSGQMNPLAGVSEDDLRNRINDAVAQGRANGMIPDGVDPTNMIVSMLGGMMGNPGQGGPGAWPARPRRPGRQRSLPQLQSLAAARLYFLSGRQRCFERFDLVRHRARPAALSGKSFGLLQPLRRFHRRLAIYSGPHKTEYQAVRLHQSERPEEPQCLQLDLDGAHLRRARRQFRRRYLH